MKSKLSNQYCVELGTPHPKLFFSFLKGALSRLRQFLETESPLKMMKNTFHFTLKAIFLLEIFGLLF